MGIVTLRATTAIAAFCVSAPAWAVTPAEVWQTWQDFSTSYGQTLTTESVETTDDGITVTGLTITQDQDGVKSEATVSELVFTDNGDGTVDVAMPADIPLTLTFPPAEGETSPTTVSISIQQPDLSLTASGTAGEVTYEFASEEATIKLDRIEGVKAEAVNLVAEVKLSGLEGTYGVTGSGDDLELDYEFNAASMNMKLSGTDPDPSPGADGASGPTDVNMSLSMADLSFSGAGTALTPGVAEDMAKALAEGLDTEGQFSAGATSVLFDLTEAGKATNLEMSGESTAMNFALGPDGLRYGAGGKAVKMAVTSPDIPFPKLEVSYAEAAFDLLLPVVAAAEPQDFVFLTKLVDFAISEEVWSMFDPGKQLPRDPATLVVDTKGTVTVMTNILDPVAMESMETPPGQVNSLDVTEIHAKFGGADLTGTGAFTFDNSDTTTFPGFPLPTGKLDLKLTGANGLMDKLVAMGVMSQDDVMGFRMMLAMFANSAADKDELTSTLEFKDKGFFANGQRLQ
jgi:hypothetical protein